MNAAASRDCLVIDRLSLKCRSGAAGDKPGYFTGSLQRWSNNATTANQDG
jgi:hypothetical protein